MTEPRCLAPWTDLHFTPLGIGTLCCCLYKGKPFPLSVEELDIPALWYTDWYRDIRRAFRDGEVADSGCRGCRNLTPADRYAPEIPDDLAPKQEANYRKAVEASQAADPDSDHLPVRYSAEFTTRCNLRCVMCAQHDSRDKAKVGEVSGRALLENMDALEAADSFRVSGGEPLVSSEAIDFIHAMATDPRLANLHLHLITNGLLLDRVLDDLRSIRRMQLNVSIDAVGERYARIRRGGSWEKVSANLERVADMRERLGKDRWVVNASTVLMKTSVEGLVEYVRWCLDRSIQPLFQPLTPTRQTRHEDLAGNPALLETLPWRENLLEAERLLDEAGLARGAAGLRRYRHTLEGAAEAHGTDCRALDEDPDEWLAAGRADGKRVAVWGTGSNYRHSWADWLAEARDRFSFVGFIDNDRAKWGSTCDGHPVMGPQALDEEAVDVVILAMTPLLRNDVLKQLRGMDWHGMVI